jgi:hypothetical protein
VKFYRNKKTQELIAEVFGCIIGKLQGISVHVLDTGNFSRGLTSF